MNGSTAASRTPRSPRSSRRPLTGEVRDVAGLTSAERDRMYALLSKYFKGAERETFERDLSGKDWAILLLDESDRIQGFSTMNLIQATVDGSPIAAVYSGDTIISREHWGDSALSRMWAEHSFRLADEIRRGEPGTRVYWFLISSGYKTYRFLPTFFREFYPTHERPTPPEMKRIMDALADAKFPTEYDPVSGVVRPAEAAPLRKGVAEITARRLSDPHVAFFAAANPGHDRGDELVCLTELVRENLTHAGRRMLGAG